MSISDKGRALLGGEGEFRYRRDMIRTKTKRDRAVAEVPQEVDDGLLTRLKALRAKLARQRQVPAYLIFSDRALIDMAAKKPSTRAQFGAVHGVGAAKQEQFADVFLREIRAFEVSP